MKEPTFWNRLRDNLARGIKVAADRTDEIARMGKLKLDLTNLKRKMLFELGELGKALLTCLDSVPKTGDLGSMQDFINRESVKKHLDLIDAIRDKIADVEKSISELYSATETKNNARTENAVGSESDKSGTAKE